MRRQGFRLVWWLGAALAATSLGACGSSSPSAAPPSSSRPAPAAVIDPGDGGDYRPELDPADFVGGVDNPYMPLAVGSRWRYEGTSDGQAETTEVSVTDRRRVVDGIEAVVVRDVVKEDGEIIEDTFDWYAQDRAGNVWYLGESTREYENGAVVSTAGSWESGVDGALPGIVMPASPAAGRAYRQEYYAGEAEDMMQIAATGRSQRVPAGQYRDVVVTTDWTPLEPEIVEQKFYAKGVGRILERKVAGATGQSALVAYTPGP